MPRDTRRPPKNYDIGYRKTPKHSRFKPGHTGNPKGRPKGARSLKTDVKAILGALVRVTRDGKSQLLTTQMAALLRLAQKAISGDGRALDRLITLARTYDDGEQVDTGSLSADDAFVLEVYQQRRLSGATTPSGNPSGDQPTDVDQGDSE